MKVELLHLTPNAAEFIGRVSAICYDSNVSPDACKRRAASCKEKGHLATARFASAVFHISGISRICSHQLVRSKHLDVLQRSQRYCQELFSKCAVPESLQNNPAALDIYFESILLAQKSYERLLKLGIKKEDARFVLPEGTETEMHVVGNMQAWMDFIALRSGKHAQWEIRAVAVAINNILAKEVPELFEEMTDV